MKALLRFTTLALLLGMVVAIPAGATNIGTLYSNGPAYKNDPTAWMIAFGQTMSSSFSLANPSTVTGFAVALWTENQGGSRQPPMDLDWSISSAPNGGTIFGSGNSIITTTFLWNKASSLCSPFTCDVWQSTISFTTPVSLNAGTYFLNLSNARTPPGDPVWWDENDGVGCTGDTSGGGCPATAYQNGVSLPKVSLDPDIYGYSNSEAPEPGSLTLFGSGILGVAAIVRRRFVA